MENKGILFSLRNFRHIQSADVKVGTGITLLMCVDAKDNTILPQIISISLVTLSNFIDIVNELFVFMRNFRSMSNEMIQEYEDSNITSSFINI